MSAAGHIALRGVRVHNLKSIDLDIPAARIDRLLRTERQRQEQPGARYALRRRTTPLHREFFGLHAAVLAAAGEAGGRADRRHSARHRRDRQEHQPIEPIDRGHRHGDERLSAAVVCQDRAYVLPPVRPRGALRKPAKRRRNPRRAAAGHALHDRLRLPRCPRRRRSNRWRPHCARTDSFVRFSTGGWSKSRGRRRHG